MPTIPYDAINSIVTNYFYITGNCAALIIDYQKIMNYANQLIEKKFGIVVFDESNTTINEQNINVANTICQNAVRTILLANDQPSFDHPVDLFWQLNLIDNNIFATFNEYSVRYCGGQQTITNWNCSGCTNLDELKLLTNKFIVR